MLVFFQANLPNRIGFEFPGPTASLSDLDPTWPHFHDVCCFAPTNLARKALGAVSRAVIVTLHVLGGKAIVSQRGGAARKGG